MNKNLKSIVGERYSRLTVLSYHNSVKGNTNWVCKCECGNTSIVSKQNLKSGGTKSCGCFSREEASKRLRTHGKSGTRLYNIWHNILIRCLDKKNKKYPDYGGRGILICDEWRNDFMNFYNWALSNGYAKNLEVDRIDNDGNYEPSNCRWVTRMVNMNNTRVNALITIGDETKTLADLARSLNISYNVARWRYRRAPLLKQKMLHV